ncbi:MAG TPA: metallophosphoesterase [Candidatus Ligilactobacillus excrementipullorum]|nr:metallophosphoesterase [Candidatus Ligilactobacillus excrementipullorum]
MGKLAIISDLHVDINKFTLEDVAEIGSYLRDEGATRLHIAGDITNHFIRDGKEIIATLNSVLPTTFNFGNHDMLNTNSIENNQAAGFLNFTPLQLNNDTVLLPFNGWYDYGFARGETDQQPADEVVANYKNKYWIDKYIHRSEPDPTISRQQAAHLAEMLTNFQQQGQRVIIATHFVPRQEFISYPTPFNRKAVIWRALGGVLGSKVIGDVISNYQGTVTDVVFGHIHARDGVKVINNVNWHCRPIGYRYEWDYTKRWLSERGEPLNFHFAKHPTVQNAFIQDMHQDWDQVLSNAFTLFDY